MRKKMTKKAVSLLLICFVFPVSAFAQEVIPLGMPIGVCMTADGVVISALVEVETPAGTISPCKAGGLETGDILQTANDTQLTSGAQLVQLVQESGGQPITLCGLRGDTGISVTVQPVQSKVTATYQLGILVRDSMAGIGTLTYAEAQDGSFGALGHPVADIDSGALLPLSSGFIVPASIIDVRAGVCETPGELIGTYEFTRQIGTLNANTACGIFGTLEDNSLYAGQQTVETALPEEVHTGDAEILTCISGNQPQKYQISIENIEADAADGRQLSIHVTDDALISVTGGIVPGMSGSPILQDGKLVGAVTHVLVNCPDRGYGILIQNMLDTEK